MRCIPIPSCGQCQFRDHKGAFGAVAYVPVCRRTNKELPHSLGNTPGGRPVALATEVIPDWCPLPELPE